MKRTQLKPGKGFKPRAQPMARGAGTLKQSKPAEPKPAKGPRPKKCANRACRAPYAPDPKQLFKTWCSDDCALVIALAKVEKQKQAKARKERAADKVKRQGMKTIPQLKAEAQIVFNKYIRERDLAAGHGCICCGKFATAAALAQPGGAYDACHYRSRGSADHARYNEDNCHLGLKDCNTWGHRDYRGGLIARIGLERVEALESDNAVVKWTRDGLEALKATYQAKLRELKRKAS